MIKFFRKAARFFDGMRIYLFDVLFILTGFLAAAHFWRVALPNWSPSIPMPTQAQVAELTRVASSKFLAFGIGMATCGWLACFLAGEGFSFVGYLVDRVFALFFPRVRRFVIRWMVTAKWIRLGKQQAVRQRTDLRTRALLALVDRGRSTSREMDRAMWGESR